MGDLNGFSKLMEAASENRSKASSSKARFLSTTFKPPKKVSRQDAKLSKNVREYLAKKEDEERKVRQRKEEEKRKLVEMRAEDSRAHKRVQLMRKSTKSASKSVMSDADVDPLAQMRQPDEDDYGFASKTESEFYNKMVQGYVAQNDEKKFSSSKKPAYNLSATKERVLQAFEREQQEAQMPHRRKRRAKHEEEEEEQYSEPETSPETQVKPKRPAQPAAPPINFMDVLKMAQQNTNKPMLDEELQMPPGFAKKRQPDEPDRLRTKREMAEYNRQKAYEERKAERLKGSQPAPAPPSTMAGPSSSGFGRIPKIPKLPKAEPEEVKVEEKALHRTPEKVSRPSERPIKSEKIPSKPNLPEKSSIPKKPSVPERPSGAPSSSKPPTSKSASDLRAKASEPRGRDSPVEQKYADKLKPPSKLLQSALLAKSSSKKPTIRPAVASPAERGQSPSQKKLGQPLGRSNGQPPIKSSGLSPSKPVGQPGRPNGPARPGGIVKQGQPLARPNGLQSGRPGGPPSARPTGQPSARPAGQPAARPNGQPSARPNGQPSARPAGHPAARPSGPLPSRPTPAAQSRPGSSVSNRPDSSAGGPKGGMRRPDGGPPRPGADRPRPGGMPQKRPLPPAGPRWMPMKKKKMVIDSESEQDSEMDDFIDDTPLEGEPDLSSVLRDVFGYDKRKYQRYDDDDDDECMESSFGQISKEEYKSTKAGLLEDLADIQKKKAMKAAAKKKQQR